MKNILNPIFLCAILLPSLSIGAPNPRGATLDITIHTSDEDKVAGGQRQQGQSLNDLSVAKWVLMQQGGNGAHGAFPLEKFPTKKTAPSFRPVPQTETPLISQIPCGTNICTDLASFFPDDNSTGQLPRRRPLVLRPRRRGRVPTVLQLQLSLPPRSA